MSSRAWLQRSRLTILPVIEFFTKDKACSRDIPLILAGRDFDSSSDDEVGSHNYTKTPEAVIFGRGFGIEQIMSIKALCERENGSTAILRSL